MIGRSNLRSRLGYLDYADIQDRINEGSLDQYDVVLIKDQDTVAYVAPDGTIHNITTRMNAYVSESAAKRALNASTTTYVGMPVAIYQQGSYKLYLADGIPGDWNVLPSWGKPDQFSYNELSDVPLINKVGTTEDVIILNELADGIYAVQGKFRITATLPKIYTAASPELVFVQNSGTVVKRISGQDIISYDITGGGEPTIDPVTTESKVNEMIDKQFEKRLEETSSESIQDLFD